MKILILWKKKTENYFSFINYVMEFYLVILGDFDLSLVDLGGDVESVEERDLGRLHSGWSSWDNDVQVGDHSDLGWGSDLVGLNDLLHLVDGGLGGIGEDESDFSLELIPQDFEGLEDLSVSSLEFSEILGIR